MTQRFATISILIPGGLHPSHLSPIFGSEAGLGKLSRLSRLVAYVKSQNIINHEPTKITVCRVVRNVTMCVCVGFELWTQYDFSWFEATLEYGQIQRRKATANL